MRETRTVYAVFPGETNQYATLFGGTAMAWMDRVAFIAASGHARRNVVTAHSDALNFDRPVSLGSIVELVARVVAVHRTSMRVEVQMWVEPIRKHQQPFLAARGAFVLVAVDRRGRPVPVPPLEPSDQVQNASATPAGHGDLTRDLSGKGRQRIRR